MTIRKFERFEVLQKVKWDFYTSGTGKKNAYITDMSRNGCFLNTDEAIDHRRWVRLLIGDGAKGVSYALVGRSVRCVNRIIEFSTNEVAIYSYGIQFTHPGTLSIQDLDLILALSSKNFKVASCLNLNSRSSFLPGSLA